MRPKIVFLLMSAQQSSELVGQLVDALAPHPVVVHHDFTKLSSFRLDRKRVHMVPDPRLTGWGTWGFCEAILHGMQYCCDHFDFDYLQLLSPTCLPIRSIAEFEAHVSGAIVDAHADLIPILQDDDARMTYSWRAFLPDRSLRQRIAMRLAGHYFGPRAARMHRSSMVVLESPDDEGSVFARLRRGAASTLTRYVTSALSSGTVYTAGLQPLVGSTWFGARPAVVRYLLDRARDDSLCGFFSALCNADEHFFATMLGNSGFAIGESNHAVSRFDASGHPVPIDRASISGIRESRKFFARKFSPDPNDMVRRSVLATIREPISPPVFKGEAKSALACRL